MGEEKSKKPREMVHKTQAAAGDWINHYRRAQRNLPQSPSIERAVPELHCAVMAYFEQMMRFRHKPVIEKEWHKQEVPGVGVTLNELSQQRLKTEQRRVTRFDSEANREVTERVDQPWTLTPRQAVNVNDQLDACAHKLGFDATTSDQRYENNTVVVEGEEREQAEQELGQHLQTVEVPGDA
jgi:hypothetical protein